MGTLDGLIEGKGEYVPEIEIFGNGMGELRKALKSMLPCEQ